MSKPVSPQTQAVLDAYWKAFDLVGNRDLAAAVRALADQVTPVTVDPRVSTIRFQIVGIADELEAADG